MSVAEALLELQALTERLRRECPWDREQTATTIVPHTVEEAYEVADAVAADDAAKLLDELGDLLFQVFFLSLLLQEKDQGNLETVARGVHDKLVRRHPHVFGEVVADTAADVRRNWEGIKRAAERRAGIFHDLPRSLPALTYARKVQRRAAAVGFDYADARDALRDLEDELRELREALAAAAAPRPEAEPEASVAAELGDVLFAAVNVARHANVDPELALRAASDGFVRRVEAAEHLAEQAGQEWTELGLEEQDRYFDLAKEELR